ncbi:MAG: heavy metal translocating P-type ATPase [Bacillota bacterium]|nr:heavy metal translocating P-type ATPase [Bacillota bacterium]
MLESKEETCVIHQHCGCSACACELEPEEEKDEGQDKKEFLTLCISAVLFLTAMVLKPYYSFHLPVFLALYIVTGAEPIINMTKSIRRGNLFDENTLMVVATIGAFATGEYAEGVAIMLFYRVGEYLQEAAVRRSRKSIKSLVSLKPDYANIMENGKMVRVDPENVQVGDIIIVNPGEKVPLDGRVVKGISNLNTSALTGESLPAPVSEGDGIYAGSLNIDGVIEVEVTKPFAESTVSKIMELVENASRKKAPQEKFITKFARFYTPAVVGVAALIAFAAPLFDNFDFGTWIYRALVFLVVSCPCALVISIPLGFFGGVGAAARRGVLVKGSTYLDSLRMVKTVVFDKTGTLTTGSFTIDKIISDGMESGELLFYAAAAESHSSHPVAKAIAAGYGKEIQEDAVENIAEVPGCGVRATVNGRQVAAGNKRLISGIPEGVLNEKMPATTVFVSVDGVYCGRIDIKDTIKSNAEKTIEELKSAGIDVVMLTGDNGHTAAEVAAKLGITRFYHSLLPQGKVQKLEEEKNSANGLVAFVGDGINDTPVLAAADVGIAMGALGSDSAIEAADIVIMDDDISRINTAVKTGRRTIHIINQNIYLALGVKLLVMLLSVFGDASMWAAVFADVGVALIAILNSMRLIWKRSN